MIIHCDQTEVEWLTRRLGGIGASEVSAILGLSRFASPWSVWRHKVDHVVEPGYANDLAEWGSRHEVAVADKFRETFAAGDAKVVAAAQPWELVDLGDYTTCWSEVTDYLFCTPDRLLHVGEAPEGGPAETLPVEIKCAWHAAAKEWEEKCPLGYQAQLQATMYMLGADKGYFAALLHGYDFRWYRVERNEKFIQAMLKKLAEFWKMVIDKTAPPVDYSEATREALAARYNEPEPVAVDLPYDANAWAEGITTLKAKQKQLAKQRTGLENRIKAEMQNAQVGRLTDQDHGFEWKPNKNGTRIFSGPKRIKSNGIA